MNYMKSILKCSVIMLFLIVPSFAHAQVGSANLSQLSAQGIAVYGWKNGMPTVLYGEKENYLFPVASITKLVTARAVELLYPENTNFTISADAMKNTQEDNGGILPGMVLSRDDMLRAMLVSSNNGVSNQFLMSSAPGVFLAKMNDYLHAGDYTQTNFVNPSGLDPVNPKTKKKGVIKIVPNRLTPQNLSRMLSDIYRTDPLMTNILEMKTGIITDQKSGTQITLKTTNKINKDPLYTSSIILSKTGVTDLSGQSLAFITSGGSRFDYVTVVFLHSKDRYTDGKLILDWLQQVLHFQA
jgi:D-alanyl-D-alanine carboxypeptidase